MRLLLLLLLSSICLGNGIVVTLPEYGDPHWKAPVTTSSALPTSGNAIGDARIANDTSTIYSWSGSAWVAAGGGIIPPSGGGAGTSQVPYFESTVGYINDYVATTGNIIFNGNGNDVELTGISSTGVANGTQITITNHLQSSNYLVRVYPTNGASSSNNQFFDNSFSAVEFDLYVGQSATFEYSTVYSKWVLKQDWLYPASFISSGLVDTNQQTFAGTKSFPDGLNVDSITGYSNSYYSLNLQYGYLTDGYNQVSVDFGAHTLYSYGSQSMTWGAGYIGTSSILNSSGNGVLNADYFQLYNTVFGSYPIIDFSGSYNINAGLSFDNLGNTFAGNISNAINGFHQSTYYSGQGFFGVDINHFGEQPGLDVVDTSGTTNVLIQSGNGTPNFKVNSQGNIFAQGIALQAGPTVTNILTVTPSISPGSISAGATLDVSVGLTGAVVGDTVMLGPPVLSTGLTVCAFVAASNTVKIRIKNETGGAINPGTQTWRVTIIRF